MEEAEETLLRLARQGFEEGVEQLLEARKNGAFSLDINCKGRSKHFLNQSPLHLATYFGHYRVVQLLLDHRADIDVVNSCGDTPLHKAALIGNEDIVLLLLERGASVSLINGEGQTPAAVSSDPYITGLLRAACCTEKRKRQERMLRAAIDGSVQALDAMLKDRDPPNINCTDVQGNTCLHVAAYRDHKPIAVLLLENGIDTQIRNTQGQLAVDLALGDQMRQLLCVTPVRKLQRSAVRCEGPLIRRFRFTGWKPVWAVLERGVLTYFGSRGDASASVRRKDYKYLDGARVASVDDPEGATVAVYFSDGTMHRLKCDTDDPVSRKKWVNALQEHIDYSTHYIRQGLGLSDSDDDEIKPLGSMQDAMQSSRAKEQLLREHIQDAMITLGSLQRASSGETSSVVVLEKLQSASACAQDMAASLSHCLALFTQQDELRQLQLHQERERCRVLEQSLHVLAEEHHQLEQSFHRSVSQSLAHHHRQQRHSVCSRAGPLSEDEFFDADGEDTSDDEGTLVSCSTPTELTEYSGISLCATPPDLSGDDDVQEGDAASVSSLSVVSSQGGHYRRPRGSNQRRKLREERKDSVKSLAETPTVLSAFGRTRLPKEQISGDDFSIWSVLKNAIGKELTKIPMPVVFNEPLSFLQRMAEFMEYSDVLEAAARQPDSISRMEYVAAFAVSGLASNWERVGKPFNPLLGETYELQHNGYRFVCEQVSHHPPVSAFHAQADRFSFHGSIHPKLKFWGRSVEIHPRGVLSVELPEHDEVYTWSNVNCCVHNIIVGKLWIEQYGTMNITNHKTGDKCTILFKPAGWFSKELHRLEGFVFDKSNTRRRFLYGRWTEFIRSTDIQSFEAYEKQNSNKFKLSSDAISKPGHSPLHSPRKVLNKLNSISAPFRSHAESDTLNVDESCSGAADGPPEGSGDVPHSMSAYSIDIPNSSTLWQADSRPAESHKFYHFTAYAMSLNQRCPGMSLCSSDSRLRPDIRALEEGNIDVAASEKNRLEEKQRDSRKDRHKRRDEWKPRYFKLCSNPHVKSDDWLFLGNYWADKDSSTLDIF